MKQTAVEWYNTKLNAIDFKLNSGLINYEQCKVEMSEAFEQAKEMEKEQIRDAFNAGDLDSDTYFIPFLKENHESENYYNKTFKSE